MSLADIGVIGLAVMGRSIALNLADHGFVVAIHNRTEARIGELLAESPDGGLVGCASLAQLVASLRRPRVCLLMIQAGSAVDEQIARLLPLLEAGDIIVDGGNTLWSDSGRRLQALEACGLHFIGMGISGGAEGARRGPALMPSGSVAAWPRARPLFEAIAARVDGVACCTWIGGGGSGHFVKMVHNGIEYADMQLIAEAFVLLRDGAGLSPDELERTFRRWNEGPSSSWLLAITADILSHRKTDGSLFIDDIRDAGEQKGTGRWTVTGAMDLAVPLTLTAEAVCSRFLSNRKAERIEAALVYPRAGGGRGEAASPILIEDVRSALHCARIVSLAQAFMLLHAASVQQGWDLRLADIALSWRAGCIIRSSLLDPVAAAFRRQPPVTSLLLDPVIAAAINRDVHGWRRAAGFGIGAGIALPALAAALAFFDGYRTAVSPANLLQAQRDYFGAHTYQRADAPASVRFHFDWTGRRTQTLLGD